MSDFDFEELDRAVSGKLDQDDRGSTESPAARSVAPDAERFAQPDRPATLASRRSQGGRFMDVVHPSSDMRTANMSVDSKNSYAPSPQPVNSGVELSQPPTTESIQPPLESPFLSDAKVEKRPLGVPSNEILGDQLSSQLDNQLGMEKEISPVETELVETPKITDAVGGIDDTESPETLEALSALESLEVPEVTEDSETIGGLAAPVGLMADSEPLSTPEIETPKIPMKPAPFADEEPNGAVSITQQYKEQPRSEEASGAIYDTEAYHQPFAQPIKKSSGTKVFVWIALLIALGVGLGVGAYYLLPML